MGAGGSMHGGRGQHAWGQGAAMAAEAKGHEGAKGEGHEGAEDEGHEGTLDRT